MKLLLNSSTLLVLSGLFTDLCAAWIASLVVAPAIAKVNFVTLLTTNVIPAIVSLVCAIWLARKANEL